MPIERIDDKARSNVRSFVGDQLLDRFLNAASARLRLLRFRDRIHIFFAMGVTQLVPLSLRDRIRLQGAREIKRDFHDARLCVELQRDVDPIARFDFRAIAHRLADGQIMHPP